MRYLRLHTLGFAALLVALTVIHCAPTEAQADRRRRPWTTYLSARGRLVEVECDMTSDTCSDGRKITTTRPTPVPCEVAPGQWEMVPEDTGCYSARGLESWAATTSYLSYGAELDREPWLAVDGATVQSLPTGGYRISGTGDNSRIMQPGIPAVPGPHTLSCIARSVDETPQARMRIYWDASAPGSVAIPVTAEWAVHSITATVPEEWEGNISIHVFSSSGTVDVIGCWFTRTDTPGRPCWGGEAPVTCARDFHRLPATGFPTTTGEISWVMRLERVPDGTAALRGIIWADGATIPNRLSLTGNGGIRVYTGETAYVTEPLSWEPGRSYTIQLIMAEDEWRVVRDGALVGSTPPLGSMDWGATVRLGDLLDGSISSLRVRSFE